MIIIKPTEGAARMINLTDHKYIHCIGIGGIGLSAIGEILLDRGYNVTGSDMKESEITTNLASKHGITRPAAHRFLNLLSAGSGGIFQAKNPLSRRLSI